MDEPETERIGHRVRIAQQGWCGSEPAETQEGVQVGLRFMWLEIDGHRFECVTHADVQIDEGGLTIPTVSVGVLGPVEIVYTDRHGEVLPGDPRPSIATDGETFDSDTGRLHDATVTEDA